MHCACIIGGMDNVKSFSDTVGRADIAAAVGDVSLAAVSNAIKRGRFPATWVMGVKRLAAEKGVDCPDALFNQRISVEPVGDAE